MRMYKKIMLSAVCVLIAIVMLSCAPGGGPAPPPPPPEEKAITALLTADHTGPVKLVLAMDQGFTDMIKEVNAAGGVDGVKIDYTEIETCYDVAKGVSAYKRFLTKPNFLYYRPCCTGQEKAMYPLLEGHQVMHSVCDVEFVANPGWGFNWGPSYADGFAVMVDFVINDWQSKGKSGMPVMGVMRWDNPFGREWEKGGLQYAENKGVEIATTAFPPSAIDYSPYLTSLEDAGMNYLIIWTVDPGNSVIGIQAHEMELDQRVEEIIFDWWAPSRTTGLMHHGEEFEGYMGMFYYITGTEINDNEFCVNLANKYRGGLDKVGDPYSSGITLACHLIDALGFALDKVGYENLDAAALKAGFESLGGRSWHGCGPTCHYSATDRSGTREVKFYEIHNTLWTPVTDWVTVPNTLPLYEGD